MRVAFSGRPACFLTAYIPSFSALFVATILGALTLARPLALTASIRSQSKPRSGRATNKACAKSADLYCRYLTLAMLSLTVLFTLVGPQTVAAQGSPTPTFKELDSIDARAQGCVTCHGQNGEGTANGYFPRIAGKPAGYLYNQLAAFRDGSRRYPPMNYLVAYLPDAYLHELADHFSKERPPFTAPDMSNATPEKLERGRVLASNGDANTGVPACMACHGSGLTGADPGIPGLVGLRPTYIVAQLTRWRVGERHATDPDCMKRVAARLSDEDVAAVALWLALQPAPKDPSPKAAGELLPYACGSQAGSTK